MLTTQNAQKIRDNVSITDVNANLVPVEPSAPKATLSPEAAILLNRSIVARPLMVPEVCSVRVKNLEYRYRWVNYSGRNGSKYMQRTAQGFTNATTDDVEVLGGDATANNGEIRAGDVILMKIRADLYDAAMKFNMEKALALQRTRGMYFKNASSDVNAEGGRAGAETVAQVVAQGSPTKRSAPSFIPDNPNALVGGSKTDLKSAAVARETIDEIRDHAKTSPETSVVGEKIEG